MVTTIEGKPVAELDAEVAEGYMHSVVVGQRVQLRLEREGKPLSVTLVATKW